MNRNAGMQFFDLPDLRGRDCSRDNQDVAELWRAFSKNTHRRPPVTLVCNPRVLLLDPRYNTRGITYKDYFEDPAVMGQVMLEFQYWTRFLLPGDQEHGLPDKWSIWIDFANTYDAAWFGAPVEYRDNQVPDVAPLLNDDNKCMLFDRGVPDPFAGPWPEHWFRIEEAWKRACTEEWTFLGVPVEPMFVGPYTGTDGLFTTACSLRGATQLCTDLLDDPEYARQLLEYVYEASAQRMRAWRKRNQVPVPQDGFLSADDSIEFLSLDQYREFVLPLHKRLYGEFGTPANRGIHLCGNAQRHFSTLRAECNITSFDVGFPVDFGRFRRELGPDVLCSGGPKVAYFLQDSPEPLLAETERILRSGILDGRRFILREGNNLPPRVKLDLCEAFYAAAKTFSFETPD